MKFFPRGGSRGCGEKKKRDSGRSGRRLVSERRTGRSEWIKETLVGRRQGQAKPGMEVCVLGGSLRAQRRRQQQQQKPHDISMMMIDNDDDVVVVDAVAAAAAVAVQSVP